MKIFDWRWALAAAAVFGFFALVRAMGRAGPEGTEDFFRNLQHFVNSLFG